ncbi:MAG: thiamine pyrophosphate-requiring protein [Peptococcaceae bacterium]|jgi:acetolactate synthase-1/2/3 large subunit|nr:thiamine pyrophosphate-requiring protein [Peptococcaceae bacterium]
MRQRINSIPGYTASDALNDALFRAGVSHIFVNSGTDYPPIIESWAKFEAQGKPKPEIIISPHEYVAMSAAQGYAQATGQPQAVFVHVDVGTQNLGGAIHNAFRCRVPVFVLAGLSPYTLEGELPGGRDSYIQYIQNAADQAGIVRGYTKLDFDLRSGKNTQQLVYRALQLAKSAPCGPVYMTATREALEEEGWDIGGGMDDSWRPVAAMGLDGRTAGALAAALAQAEKPLVITSYLGRNKESVGELVRLCERLAVPVAEMVPSYMNFPMKHPMYFGGQVHEFLKESDLILVIDCDLPWTPAFMSPKEGCRVFYLDIDPIKEHIPLWYIPAEMSIRADSGAALRQLNEIIGRDAGALNLDEGKIAERRKTLEKRHSEMAEKRNKEEAQGGVYSAYLTACIREIIDDDTIILNETITDRPIADGHLPRSKPGTLFGSGGSSLGWFGGAAVGVKLACPDKDVVALASDGTFVFSCPTAVYWMARRYKTPFLTVIYNNQGWNAPKMITKGQHPDGYAAKSGNFWTSFQPSAALDRIAEAAGGAFARTVTAPEEILPALREGKKAVENGTAAVINVLLPPV